MAMTLVEMAKVTNDPVASGVYETLYTEEPFYQYIPFRSVPGLSLHYTSEKELPNVGFRKLNEAFSESTGVLQRDIEVLRPFGGDSDTDKVLVDAYGNSERATYDAMWLKAMAVKYIQFCLYGNASRAGAAYVDAEGFDGLMRRITSAQTVDATASSGSDGSSVFAIRFGDGYFQGLMTGGKIDQRDLGELGDKPVYRTRTDATMGMAIYNGKSVAMVKDLAAATETLTTTLMDELQDKITGRPDVYLMSKRSRRQLKTSAIGKGVALSMTIDRLGNPIESWGGVPILVSDAVIDTETNSS